MFQNLGLVKTHTAAGEIAENRIVQFAGDVDGYHGEVNGEPTVAQADAADNKFAGVAGLPKGVTAEEGDAIDVIKSGIANVEYGDTVAAGDYITSDAEGRAVVAQDGDNYIGIAQYAGEQGDLGGVLLQWGSLRLGEGAPPSGGYMGVATSQVEFTNPPFNGAVWSIELDGVSYELAENAYISDYYMPQAVKDVMRVGGDGTTFFENRTNNSHTVRLIIDTANRPLPPPIANLSDNTTFVVDYANGVIYFELAPM